MIRIKFCEGKCMANQSISKIAYLVLLWSAHCGFAEEKFTALATLQQGWEKSRTEVQVKLDKEYLAQLTEKRKSLVRKGGEGVVQYYNSAEIPRVGPHSDLTVEPVDNAVSGL